MYVVDGGGQGERLQRGDQSLISSYLKVLNLRLCFSSITIDDVVYVADGGRIKVKDYNMETNL